MGRRRGSLDIEISGGSLEALQELSERSGRPVTEELRFAISDRKFFTEKVREGYRIKVIDRSNPGDEILVDYS